MLELSIFLGSFLATYFGVAWFLRWSVKRGVMDHPNERSSHVTPTPRGGGLVIALVVLAAYVGSSFLLDQDVSWAFLASASLVVAVSWLDDVYSLSFVWRFVAHSIAAAVIIAGHGYFTAIPMPFGNHVIEIGWFGAILSFCWIVWLVNAYNFMDGIDGIAGLQAVTAGFGWVIVGLSAGVPVAYVLGGTVLFAALAFLLHNWPPARIFMGDAGSAFLGFVFAALPFLVSTKEDNDRWYYFIIGILLVWLFVFDSVLTVLRRLLRGEKVWHAHREHLYQRLVRSGYSHLRVTVLYGLASFLIAVGSALSVTRPEIMSVPALIILVAIISVSLLLICCRHKCLFGEFS